MPIGHTFSFCIVHQGHQRQGDAGDQEDHREHLVKGEGLLHPGHVDTQTAEAAQPLADDRTHHAVGSGDTKAGEKLGQGRGEFDVPEDLRAVKVMICGFADAASMTYRPAPAKPKGTFRRLVWGTVAAAASVALCVAYFNREIYGYDADGKAITDPEIALEGTQYLSYLSQLETTIDIAQMITQGMENNN